MMAVANMLKHLSADTRELYLFDTFGGMSAPTKDDITSSGEEASPFWEQSQRNDNDNDWCYASLEEVEANMAKTSYNKSQVHYVKGMVEETIPAGAPAQIALLRLDTDWYESTYHEMVHLYPKLSPGGVLILDDYGFWQGAKKAVDQYFDEQGIVPMLARIDDTARIMVKPI